MTNLESVLLDILPTMFVVVLILGVAAWIGFPEETAGEKPPSRTVAAIRSYIKEHRKLCQGVLVVGVIMCLLQLVTYL